MSGKFRSMTAVFLALGLFLICPEKAYAAKESPIQHRIVYEFNETNGLPTGEANTVLQTSDGFVWIGSYGGLIRYDGTSFRNYSDGGVFPSSSVRALFEDSKGRLWIGTNDMGVFLYENGGFKRFTYEDKTKYLSVRDFTEDKNGTVYAATTSGMAKIGENCLEYVAEWVSDIVVYSIDVDANGVIWACIDGGMAILVSDGEIKGSFESDGLLDSPLYCVGHDSDGTLYLGTSGNSIYRLELADDSYTKSSYKLTELKTGEVSTFNAIAEDNGGNLWAAALNGVGYFDGDFDWHTVDAEHATSAGDIAFDYEGNVWIASGSYGIIHLVEGQFCNANAAAELSETSINAAEVCDGSIYLATDTGIVILDGDYRQVHNELTEMLNGDRVRNITADSEGSVWIGTYYNNALVRYDPDSGEIKQFSTENGLSDNQIRMILELSDGGIAVASQNGVSIIRDGEVTNTYAEAEGLSYPIILCLCEGADGTLYAGSDGQGFYAIKDDTVTHYGFEQGLPAGVVLRMLPDGNEGLFISAGNSLYYWDFQSFRLLDNYSKSPGSIFDMCFSGNELWLMQSNGINAVDRARLLSGEDTAVRVIGVSYGLTGSLNANSWNDICDGLLYLCTANGLSILDMEESSAEHSAINALIYRVTADDDTFEIPGDISVDGNTTRLTFDFAALSYSGKEVTVRYRLKGFDDRAYSVTNANPMTASYTNLSGGDYEFLIEVMGTDGESVIASHSIKVHKNFLFWEYLWFKAVLSILLLGLIILVTITIIRVKTNHLKRRQREYQHLIGESLRTFANAIDAKDKYTNGHSLRVAAYTLELAKKLNVSPEDQERLYYIALLHDIGKIGIPDRILNKPGKLTPEEIEVIRRHPAIGGEILKDFKSLPGISDGARYHHERYDGKGYNEGLKGEEIPFFARIICVADSYDTMAGGRRYSQSRDSDFIKEELKRCSGTQFDPVVVDAMLQIIEEGKAPITLEDNNIRMFYIDHDREEI